MAEERNKNAFVSENFFVPKSRQQSRGRPEQQRRPKTNGTDNGWQLEVTGYDNEAQEDDVYQA